MASCDVNSELLNSELRDSQVYRCALQRARKLPQKERRSGQLTRQKLIANAHTHDIRTHKHHATPVLALTAHVTAHALVYSTTGTPIAMAGLCALGAYRNLRYSTGKRCGTCCIGVLAHSNQYAACKGI